MRSPTKGSNFIFLSGGFRPPPLTWKTLITLTLVIILFLEWKRFNQIVENQPQVSDQPAYYDAGEGGESLNLNSDSRHGRQLLKKLSNGINFNSRSTTTAPESLENAVPPQQVKTEDDKSFGDSVSLAHWIEERQKVYEARQRRVEAICHKNNVSTMSSNDTMEDLINFSVHNDSATGRYVERVRKDHFLLSRANQLMGCLINKVASSSMMRMYLTLQGIDQKKIESPHGFRTKFVPENEKELKFSKEHFFKFMLVRHPMERLVSCYFDKMVNGTHKSLKGFRKFVKNKAQSIRRIREGKFNKKQSASISEDGLDRPIGSYPKNNPWMGTGLKSKKNKNPDFVDVKKTSVKKSKPQKWSSSDIKNKKRIKREIKPIPGATKSKNVTTIAANFEYKERDETQIIPTLDDFLEFILTDLTGQGFSSHWVPYWRMCTPCHFKYDMIGKLETGFDDFTYLWKKTDLDSKAPIPWYHAGLTNEKDHEEKHLIKMKSFYSKVPRSTLLRVYEAYKLDFELFDYDFNQVLVLAGYEPLPNI